ncbi:MAG: glycosyltransferase family 87 protein [Bdellovibrionota bacterium]
MVKASPHWGAWFLISLVTIALFIRYPANQEVQLGGQTPTDFGVYMRAWQRVNLGENPYVLTDGSPYKYAPGALALFKVMPDKLGNAWFVFGTLSIFALGLALTVGVRYVAWRNVLWVIFGLIFAWKGILETLDYGQLELLIVGVATVGAALLPHTPFTAGLLIGTLPWFKLPWLALALPFLLVVIRRDQKGLSRFVSGYMVACFLWAAAIPSWLFGSERALYLSQQWFSVLRAQPKELYYSDINQSLWVSVTRWMGSGSLAELCLALGLGAMGLGILIGWLMARPSRTPTWQGALPWMSPWLILIQLLNPLSWRWGSVFLVGVPLAVFGGIRRTPVASAVLFFLICIFWLIQQNPFVRALGFHHWTELHQYGVITAYWLLFLVAAAWKESAGVSAADGVASGQLPEA